MFAFSLALMMSMMSSCEKAVDLKGASMLGDAPVPVFPGFGCGLYHSYWHESGLLPGDNFKKTTIYKIDIVAGNAVFKKANLVPFDMKFHIAIDRVGRMFMIDEVSGDLYSWVPGDPAAPTMIMDYSVVNPYPIGNIQFTQAVIADYATKKLLAVSSTKPGFEVVIIFDISTPGSASFVKTIDLNGKVDIEGADMAVLPGSPDILRLYTKSTLIGGSRLYNVKISDGSVSAQPTVVTDQITVTAYDICSLWVTRGNSTSLYKYDALTLNPPVEYPITGDAQLPLVYGDLASCSPEWSDDNIYHSYWNTKTSTATTIYHIIPDAGTMTAKFEVVNPVPFEQRVHIAMDDDGWMYLVDETNGDIYKWAPNSYTGLGAPYLLGSALFPGVNKKQFTQLVIAQTATKKHLFVSNMLDETIYRIDLATGTVVQTITSAGGIDWDISGADLAVTRESNKLYVFSKADNPLNPGKYVYKIDLSAGPSISVLANEDKAGDEINGSTFFNSKMWLTKGSNLLQTYKIADPNPLETYTMIDNPRLIYGDLASKSPVWDQMANP